MKEIILENDWRLSEFSLASHQISLYDVFDIYSYNLM